MKLVGFALLVSSFPILAACASATQSPDPDVDFPGEGGPPAAVLRVNGQAQTAGVGSHCWPYPDEETAICADYMGVITPRVPLVVSAPIDATIEWPLERAPDNMSATFYPVTEETEMQSEGPARVWEPPFDRGETIEFQGSHGLSFSPIEPGLYVLTVFGAWEDTGDVTYGFLLEVQ